MRLFLIERPTKNTMSGFYSFEDFSRSVYGFLCAFSDNVKSRTLAITEVASNENDSNNTASNNGQCKTEKLLSTSKSWDQFIDFDDDGNMTRISFPSLASEEVLANDAKRTSFMRCLNCDVEISASQASSHWCVSRQIVRPASEEKTNKLAGHFRDAHVHPTSTDEVIIPDIESFAVSIQLDLKPAGRGPDTPPIALGQAIRSQPIVPLRDRAATAPSPKTSSSLIGGKDHADSLDDAMFYCGFGPSP